MTAQEWEVKYNHLLTRVRRMRGYQKEYLKYLASSDKAIMLRMQREVDQLVEQGIKAMKANQKEIF